MDALVSARHMHRHLLLHHRAHCSHAHQSQITGNWVRFNGNASKFGFGRVSPDRRRVTGILIDAGERFSPSNLLLLHHQLPLPGRVDHSQGHRPHQRLQARRQRFSQAVPSEDPQGGRGVKLIR